jgi:hypothetical protein
MILPAASKLNVGTPGKQVFQDDHLAAKSLKKSELIER